MVTVNDIKNLIDDFAPFNLAEDWDNVGLLIGSGTKKVKKILVTLDVDEKVANEAAVLGCDVIVSHHPLMFRGVKHLTDSNPGERTLRTLVASDIALVSAHTNLDSVRGGLNDYLSALIGLGDTKIIEPTGTHKGEDCGFGRIGKLKKTVLLSEILADVCSVLETDAVRYTGDCDKTIETVAINCGGGADAMDECIRLGADLFITGDVKYNPFRDAYESGMAVIDAGHYETEHIVIALFEKLLKDNLPNVEIVRSKDNVPVIKYFVK